MISSDRPALVLAPMEGITDAPMRALQGEWRAFDFAVSEFIRVATGPVPKKVFQRDVPELAMGAKTRTGMPVYVQILGGDPDLMATSALRAVQAGAPAVDINFGCPAPTVNRHDGGSTLLKYPCRIRDIVSAVRSAVPEEIPVSAKLRLGWDTTDAIFQTASMAAEGGANWLTIHARTRDQGYRPPVHWKAIRQVRSIVDVPVIANGDIWTLDDFHRCQDETGSIHFMLGRSALANPGLPTQIAREMGKADAVGWDGDWIRLFRRLLDFTQEYAGDAAARSPVRLKQWTKLAANFGEFPWFDQVKLSTSAAEFLDRLKLAA